MRCDLEVKRPRAVFPDDIRIETWRSELSSLFFQTYEAAFGMRPNFPGWTHDQWLAWHDVEDDGFRPEYSLLAMYGDTLVGFVMCDDEWIAQIGVHPEWCRRGIGSALIGEVLHRFQSDGRKTVILYVNRNNTRAIGVYKRAGFRFVGDHATFVRRLT